MMDLIQTKTVGLTMELDLKAKEFNILCNKLDKLKNKNIDPNDERLLEIKKMFEKNNEEISEILNQINKLKEENKKENEKNNYNNIFKNKKETIIKETNNLPIEIKKESFFNKFISFVKKVLNI